MKKLLIVLLLLFMSGCESAETIDCKTNENVSGRCIDETAPIINGVADIEVQINTDFDPLDGVTAIDDLDGDITSNLEVTENVDTSETGTYLVRYQVIDEQNNTTIVLRYIEVVDTVVVVTNPNNMIGNGNFQNGMDGFDIYQEPGEADADFNIEEGVLVTSIKNIYPDRHYAPRISYGGLFLEQGATYQVSFRAKADSTRYLHVQVGELIDEYPWYVDFTDSINKLHLLTTSYQTFTFSFTMFNETNYNGSILFEMGDVGEGNQVTDIYLDDITMVKTEDLTTVHQTEQRIEAEDYNEMDGIVVEDTGDIDGVSNIGYFDPGDYIEYVIEVLETGNYIVNHRLASDYDNISFQMIADNQLLYEIAVPNTGGWQSYQSVVSELIYLEKGVHTFRITSNTGAFNINYFIIEKVN